MKIEIVKAEVLSALNWLRNSQQHTDSVLPHTGLISESGIRLLPVPITSLNPVFVFTSTMPFTRDEDTEIQSLFDGIERLDGGVGCYFMTLTLSQRANHSIDDASDNWFQGCPKHHNLRCGCGWHTRGNRKLRVPEGWSVANV